jgi:hypothetical protein
VPLFDGACVVITRVSTQAPGSRPACSQSGMAGRCQNRVPEVLIEVGRQNTAVVVSETRPPYIAYAEIPQRAPGTVSSLSNALVRYVPESYRSEVCSVEASYGTFQPI